ncbi:YchJ family protein [Herminiimonas sp. CN]|uniref:YchJ family protein n=1 Tax=Herminiimonas sp. CN TaxID=1349818 RepID=UPI00047319B9|nr:YchJ family metal-binding protein [Herminiimonas sp. CN]
MKQRIAKPGACPCGGGTFADCCAPFLSGARVPPTAEALMRSRYTAYALRDEAYLLATWHPGTRPAAGLFNDDDGLIWLGLEIKSSLRLRKRKDAAKCDPDADSANNDTVEFVARYRSGGRAHRLHEVSRFVREQGRWFYVDGSFPE